MSGLVDQIFESGVWVNSACRFSNNVGSPIASATPDGSGRAIPDKYTLTFSNINIGAKTADCTISTVSANNPHRSQIVGVKQIHFDGVTAHTTVVPGVSIVFTDSPSWVNTWAGEIRVGDNLGVFASSGDEVGPGDPVRHRVHNDTSGAAAGCKALLQSIAIPISITNIIFTLVKPAAPSATEKTAGGGSEQVTPYHITVANVTGSGAGKTMDLHVDGGTVAVAALDGSYTGPSTGLAVTKNYKITSGALQSLEFKLDQSATGGNQENIMIFEPRHLQIAPDVAGITGTLGTAQVTLTSAGQAAGVIGAGEDAYYWLGANVVDGANAESNPYPCFVFLSGKQTGSALWRG
jgi:hypothetical protein